MEELRGYLKTFGYPLVDSMSEDQFLAIFHKSNRCFLVSWLLQLLDDKSERYPQTEEALGQKLYQFGFLNEFEKDLFMKGKLNPARQFEILITIFKHICIQSSDVAETTDDIDLKFLTTQDLNLFPSYGGIKLYEEGSETFLEETDTLLTKEDIAIDFSEISRMLNDIRECLPEVKYKGEQLKEQDRHTKTEIKTDPRSFEVIHKCNENIKIIKQFLEDVDVLDHFLRDNNVDSTSPSLLASCDGQIRRLKSLLDLTTENMIDGLLHSTWNSKFVCRV
ncbi:unnamed protein product [Acanthoscelides obtectus]|nr:unnamed protein product [Acanthoscelides obtectus]CAK1653237.1 hypothetical protein AOBTE_LOCUS18143 [Acanthoscelides obtectus]